MCLQSSYLAVAGWLVCYSLAVDISSGSAIPAFTHHVTEWYSFSWIISELSLQTGAFQFLLYFCTNYNIGEICVISRSFLLSPERVEMWPLFHETHSAVISPLTCLHLVHASLKLNKLVWHFFSPVAGLR
jgi:hypothetical protein